MISEGKKMDKNIVKTPVRWVRPDGTCGEEETFLLSEHTLEIWVNGEKRTSLTCTACDLKELAAGWLLGAGIIKSGEEIIFLEISEDNRQANVLIREAEKKETSPANSMDQMDPAIRPASSASAAAPAPADIFALALAFQEETKLHRESQGTHSCMLWHRGKVVYRSEDISRHNAADKAIGYALLNRICMENRRTVLFDLHSFSDEITPVDFLEAGRKTPDLCIGTADTFTPVWLTDIVRTRFEEAGFSTAVNYPYRGCCVPECLSTEESTSSCIPVMLEFNKRSYIKENGFLDDEKVLKIRQVIRDIVSECAVREKHTAF